MPGPPSATFRGTTDVTFCDDELNNGSLVSECNHPQYQKTPEAASPLDFITAKVIPGPTCRPNPDFTQANVFTNASDTVNQDDAEPCNCHDYGIRLAINRGSEETTSSQSMNVAKSLGVFSEMVRDKSDSPCSFRSASFAWNRLGDNEFGDATIMAMNPNPQGRVQDMKFDPDGVQFKNTNAVPGDECDPASAPTCGNTTEVSVNELLNFCFVDSTLGLDKDQNVFVTQAQVEVTSALCHNMSAAQWRTSTGVDRQCCMIATVGPTATTATPHVVIRRDLLLAAGCRATTHSPNNGDGKMHRPDDIIPEGVFQGIVNLDSGRPPYNFDYPSVLESVPRVSMDDAGVNRVCLLPQAYEQLSKAECALVTQHDAATVAPDKSRRSVYLADVDDFDSIFLGFVPSDEQPGSLPWQAESCIVPHQFVHRESTEDVLPADDLLRLFGMFPRTNKVVGPETEADYRLPLYYHILANAMKGRRSFQLMTTTEIVGVLSTMSPSQYIFSGGLIFGRHFWRFDWGDHFGPSYEDTETLHGRTFYGKACEKKCSTPDDSCNEDRDKTVPPQYCLGGQSFLETSWCEGVREENRANLPTPYKDDASLIDAYILKMSQNSYSSLPDRAVLVVTRCAEKFPASPVDAASCVTEASEEFVARANTCDGMPTDRDGQPFAGRGANPGKECKASQAPQRNPHLYTEEAQTMPTELYFSECPTETVNDRKVLLFSGSAPKLTGFVHPLFYESLESRRTMSDNYPQPNSESHPTERFPNGIASNTFTAAGLHPILDNEADVAAFYSVNDAFYEVWDEEETYIYDGYCEGAQFAGGIRDYPGFKMASGADYRFDSSRDGCSNEVKRGRTEAFNFLSSLHDQPGCKKTIGTVPQHGEKARRFFAVSPTLYPHTRYSSVKSMLTPGKMAGDICKSVGEGLVSAAAFAGAVFTDGATLSVGLIGLGAVMEVTTINTIETTLDPNPIRIPINPTLGAGSNPGQRESEINKYNSRQHIDLIMEQLNNQDSDVLQKLTDKVQKVTGRDPARGSTSAFIVAEDAAFIESAELTLEHNAALNYVNVYGPFTQAVIQAIITNSSYYEGAQTCSNWQKTADGDAYLYDNSDVLDVFGNPFRQIVLDRNTRGDEASGSGEALLPDVMAFSQTFKYEWHPYISRMTPNSNYRNRMPTFMSGPFVTPGDSDTVSDGEWQNAIGTFPSIKVGQTMYCSRMLEKNTISYHTRKQRFRAFETESGGSGRANPSIATRVRFSDVVGDVFRLRDLASKTPVFGTYSEDVDGITPEMAQRCNLCSMYGSPLKHTPIDDECVTNSGLPLVYKLGKDDQNNALTLHDPWFDSLFENSVPYSNPYVVSFESEAYNLSSSENQEMIEGLIGMKLDGTALAYKDRPCSGNVQSTPAGIPGICELQKQYYVLESDKSGMKCPIQRANYGARCVNPFWINDNRLIWPTASTGYDSRAQTPNYCFNAFDKMKDGTAYEATTSNGKFQGWKAPRFDPSSSRYTYCLNDPLNPAERNTFCQGGGYRGYVGYTVGAWNDIAKICTRAIPGGDRICVWFPDNPNGLGLQDLITDAPTNGLATGDAPMKVKIFIVPISWAVARLVWSYAAVSDLSFFNFNNVEGTVYTPFDSVDEASRGPFAAQTLAFDQSANLWGKVCNINLMGGSDETTLRTAFAVMLDAVNRMRAPNGDYIVPIWDQKTPLFNGGFNFTRSMREDEVFPEIVTAPLQVREHEISIESAFGYSTIVKTNIFADPARAVRMPIFVPQSQQYCTIFEVGYPNFEVSFVEFRMTRCSGVEPYRRTPIVFSSRDVSGGTVESVVVVDAPVATLFKGDDRFDGFTRELGWTLKVTGAMVQNVVFRQTLEENDATHGVLVGAARTLDSVGAFACGPTKRRCNSVTLHLAGSIGNLTEADDGDQDALFACDGGVPQRFSSYEDALFQLGQEDEAQKLYDYTFLDGVSCQVCFNGCQSGTLEELRGICFANYSDGCRAIICLNGGDVNTCQLRNDTTRADYAPEDCYALNVYGSATTTTATAVNTGTGLPALYDVLPFERNETVAERAALSQTAWNAALGTWAIYDGGAHHPHATPDNQIRTEDGTTFSEDLEDIWWLAKTSASREARVVRCSGKGCPEGQTGCTERCADTATAFGTYGLIQDWKLKVDSDETLKLCALGNPSLCTPERFVVTDSNQLARDHANFRQGVFALEFANRRGLCLTRANMSLPAPCDVLDLNQRWTLGENTRIQSDDPYVCATAFADELRLFSMACFPCQVSETALRPCTESQSMHIFASDSPPEWLESELAVAVPVSHTHSVAIQLYSGACSISGTNTPRRCRPECAGPSDLVCDRPLGAGIAMCEQKLSKGPLVALRGNDISLVYSSVPVLYTAVGQISGSVASIISFDSSAVVYQSNATFLEDEPLVLSPPIAGTIRASVAKVIFQPIDELGDFQTSSVTLVNVSDIVERFGANVLTEYAEQFEESMLIWQVLVAILSAVLFAVIVLHIALAYREQKTIAQNLVKLDEEKKAV